MKVLNIGCGPGRLTIPLAKNVSALGEVTAMDIQLGMIEKVREKAQASNVQNIIFIIAGIGEGKLKRSYYDRVLLVTVLGEIPNQQGAFNEIYDTLKPGGILSVTEVIFDPHFQSRSVVRNLTHGVGLVEKNTFGNRFAYTLHFQKLIKEEVT